MSAIAADPPHLAVSPLNHAFPDPIFLLPSSGWPDAGHQYCISAVLGALLPHVVVLPKLSPTHALCAAGSPVGGETVAQRVGSEELLASYPSWNLSSLHWQNRLEKPQWGLELSLGMNFPFPQGNSCGFPAPARYSNRQQMPRSLELGCYKLQLHLCILNLGNIWKGNMKPLFI